MKIAAIVVVATISVSLFWQNARQTVYSAIESRQSQVHNDEGKKGKKKEKQATVSDQVKIVSTWEMPAILREISGIAYISSDRFACIQDELGTIFIYNTKSNTIEQEIHFGEAGDYEGITLVGKTAYIVRSDGRLYELDDITSSSPQVQQYESFLTAEQDVEGLSYDQKHNRILLSLKGVDPNSQDYKGIYAFDLASKKLLTQPVYKIALKDPRLEELQTQKSKKSILQPSDIEVHPLTGEIYLTEAVNHQILVIDTKGNLKNVYQVDKSLFAKPEGITFSTTGELFISNEGKKASGTILQVNMANNAER